jgi:hypothetical protein
MKTATDFLRGLGLPRAGSIGQAPALLGRAEIGGASFAELLGKVKAGEISSGLPVVVSKDAGIELTEDQLARLAHAADKAQAAGVTRALVELDGKWVMLDVGVREVTGIAELSEDGAALTGFDGVVKALPAPLGSGTAHAERVLSTLAPRSPDLLRMLGVAKR